MPNRLAGSTSPYLLQHVDNPVAWWPWQPEAFAEAARRDVPVLLSVGYSACHWCHVMAHESFENPQLAAQLNDGFVPIKVDREERPDIDAVYMAATQAMTGQGGWPMTVFLTPDRQPFFAGTYFPPEPHGELPGFGQLLDAISHAWQHRRADVLDSAGTISASIAEVNQPLGGDQLPVSRWATELDGAGDRLLSSFDPVRGGFGRAPKFPPAMACEFLLRHYERTGDQAVLHAVSRTLEAMARGGIYDQLAGGFARYSVDADWVVPHFEKMLYDNALLLRVYLHHARITGSALSSRVCAETVEFLLAALRTDRGAFASALDADTTGVEGLTYAWTPAQLIDVLGEVDGRWAASLCEVTDGGTFEHGSSVLQLLRDPNDPALWSALRTRLLEARNHRPQPARDGKVILSWNGLLIAALAEAGVLLDRTDWVSAAVEATETLIAVHRVDGRWWRASLDGRLADAPAMLTDHADLADGLLALHQATGEMRYLGLAGHLLDLALQHFADDESGFYDTADDAETLVVRPRDITDGVTPAGASGLVDALISYAALTGQTRYRDIADRQLGRTLPVLAGHPRSAGRWLATAENALRGPLQVAVVGAAPAPLLAVARAAAPAGTVFVVGDGVDDRGHGLLEYRFSPDADATAYVCRGFVCERPVTSADELIAQLRR